MVYLAAPLPRQLCGDSSGHICGNGVVHYTASGAAICGDRCWAAGLISITHLLLQMFHFTPLNLSIGVMLSYLDTQYT